MFRNIDIIQYNYFCSDVTIINWILFTTNVRRKLYFFFIKDICILTYNIEYLYLNALIFFFRSRIHWFLFPTVIFYISIILHKFIRSLLHTHFPFLFSICLAISQLSRAFIDPVIVLFMLMLSFIFVIICCFFEWKRICASLVFLYCHWRSSYQEVRDAIPLTGLTLPHFCACSNPESGFPLSYVTLPFFCVQWVQLRQEVLVCFVDIGGIVDHHCLNFVLFCWYWRNCWPSLLKLSFVLLILEELLTITA